jgi:hypothetical protein
LDTSLTAITSPPAARSLHDICQAARRGTCGPFCGALPGDECVFTSAPASVPVTGDTPTRPARGYHMARFARAQSRGLISAAEFAAVTQTTPSRRCIAEGPRPGTRPGAGRTQLTGEQALAGVGRAASGDRANQPAECLTPAALASGAGRRAPRTARWRQGPPARLGAGLRTVTVPAREVLACRQATQT